MKNLDVSLTRSNFIRYHAFKIKVSVGQELTFSKDDTVPAYEKILAKYGARPVGSVGVPLNGILYKTWDKITVTG